MPRKKNHPIFSKVAKTAAKEKITKIQNTFLNSYLGENVIKVLPFFGYFINEPTKSSLIDEISPNLVTLVVELTPDVRLRL